MKPITVAELIKVLKTVDNKNALVGISVDSEGNGYSLIPNEQFIMEGYAEPRLGYLDYVEEEAEEAGESLKPAIILFGSN